MEVAVALTEYLYHTGMEVQRVTWLQQVQQNLAAELVVGNFIQRLHELLFSTAHGVVDSGDFQDDFLKFRKLLRDKPYDIKMQVKLVMSEDLLLLSFS